MKLNARSAIVFPLILLSLLALLTFWINNTVQPTLPKMDGSSRHDPDYIMSNFVTTQTDINGGLRYRLAAVEMKHFPDDDSTNLLRPRYTQFTLDKPYTQVESLHGYVSSNGEDVQLVDNVKVTRQAFAGKGEMTVETELLNIRPKEDLVHTESPVVIRQAPKTVIYATGMIYEKKNNTVTLLHQVRAHYERPSLTKTNVTETDQSLAVASEKPSTNNTSTAKPTIEPKTNQPNTNDARIRRRYE
ncbi:MAG TPA: LPS export ABC transporter periplasmic protein LptC [Methylotenera sp.]|nr:LPS export ABC transporter periplasmic protein LptC [Methylotenera sp.]